MPDARRVLTSRGDALYTEDGDHRCWDGDEICSVEVEVPAGTKCDICDKEIE